MVRHDLLDSYAHPCVNEILEIELLVLVSATFTCEIARQAVNVNLEEQLSVESAHVEEVVEEGAEDSNTNVGDEEESHHF